jgi:ribonuclease P protein component
MLDRSHRFHGYNALNFAYKNGQTVRGPALGLKYVINPRRSTFRVAVVVSKKVSKSAVVRNRIRRRVTEVTRLQAPQISQPYDLIFSVFNEELAIIDSQQLQNLVVGQLRKAGVITTVKQVDHGIVSTEGKAA